jgi:hypothetical protein
MEELMIHKDLYKCTNIKEAKKVTGMTGLQLYQHLKSHGIDMQFPHLWLSQIQPRNHSIEVELEESILK